MTRQEIFRKERKEKGNKAGEAIIRCFGHVRRGEEEYIDIGILEMDAPARRTRGKLKGRFMNAVKNMLVVGVAEDAEDRRTYRRVIHCGDP